MQYNNAAYASDPSDTHEQPHAVLRHSSDYPSHSHRHHHHYSSLLTRVLLGVGLVSLAIIAAPYVATVMDAQGILPDGAMDQLNEAYNQSCGGPQFTHFTDAYMENPALDDAGNPIFDPSDPRVIRWPGEATATITAASGWAADAKSIMLNLPFGLGILAQNSTVNAVASFAVGLGGSLLGRYISKREDGSQRIRWGNVIKTAALVTSFLIASPALFTGLSMGLSTLSVLSAAAPGISAMLSSAAQTLGSTGMNFIGEAGLQGALPAFGAMGIHLISCGMPLLSLTGGLLGSARMSPSKNKDIDKEMENASPAKGKFSSAVIEERLGKLLNIRTTSAAAPSF